MFFAPYPKNPVIGAFFREIDRADELGSGMRNLMKYGKAYGGADPQLIEADVFRMIISVPEFGEKQEKMAKVVSTPEYSVPPLPEQSVPAIPEQCVPPVPE